MVILPLGHDKEVFHFPYVTIGIIAICVGIQFYASFSPAGQSGVQQKREYRLRIQIWRRHARKYMRYRGIVFQRPRTRAGWRALSLQMRKLQKEFFQDYEAGRIVSKNDIQYQHLKRLIKKRNHLSGVLAYGFRMRDLASKPYTLLTSAFVHGGWLHLIGNMLFLFLCGSNLEDRWGPGVWAGFYIMGSILSALTFGFFHPESPQVLVGASGAIAAAMGGFLLLYYNTRIKFFYFVWLILPFSGTFFMRAIWVLPLWLLQQLSGLHAEASGQPIAVAYSAHVGGFVVGVAAVLILKMTRVDQKLSKASEKKAILYENHPLYEQGLNYKEQGKMRLAEASFSSLLRQQPSHVEALLELSRLQENPAEAVDLANRAIQQAQRSGKEEMVLYAYNDIAEQGLTKYLDERSLFAVAKCFERTLPEESFILYHRIIERFPQSALAPKAMLEIARLQLEDSPHLAIKTLQELVAYYNGTVFAEQARSMLRKLEP